MPPLWFKWPQKQLLWGRTSLRNYVHGIECLRHFTVYFIVHSFIEFYQFSVPFYISFASRNFYKFKRNRKIVVLNVWFMQVGFSFRGVEDSVMLNRLTLKQARRDGMRTNPSVCHLWKAWITTDPFRLVSLVELPYAIMQLQPFE